MLVLWGLVIECLYGNIRSWGWGVCEGFQGVRVVGFWGSCLIIYLYNLQKKGLAEREGGGFYKPPWEYCGSRVVFLATSTILCLKKVKPMNEHTILQSLVSCCTQVCLVILNPKALGTLDTWLLRHLLLV